VRRVFAAALVLALLALAAPPRAAISSLLGPNRGAAAECTWQRHSKRVVKRVRRHGRVRKVVRRKHWWSCVATAPSPATAPPALAPPVPPALEPESEEEAANRLAVKSLEFYFVLSRPKVKAGEVTVELNNQGQDAHNLNIQAAGGEGEVLQIPETPSLQHNVAHFELPPGKYRLWCSLPEHEEKGMETTLLVE
jgi:plastocyanin